MFIIEKTVQIKAPASVVWEVITDLPRYPEWNPFCVECVSTLKPGDAIDMQVKLGARPQKQREWMMEFVPGKRFAYRMKPVPGCLSSFRSHDVEGMAPAMTRYRSCFHLKGWMRYLVLAIFRSKLEQGFAGMTDAIRRRSESLWAQRQKAARA